MQPPLSTRLLLARRVLSCAGALGTRRFRLTATAAVIAGVAACAECSDESTNTGSKGRESLVSAHKLEELQRLLQGRSDVDRSGWLRLVDAYGSADQCFMCYLQTSKSPMDAADAADRIVKTLEFRAQHNLDRPDISRAIEEHPARSTWPFVMAERAPDGCPVIFARLANLDVGAAMNRYDEPDIIGFVAMWFEQALRMQADTLRSTGTPCHGTYDVYDCAGVRSWYKVIYDVKAFRGALGRIFAIGNEHYPDQLYRCFVLNAPSIATVVWRLLSAFLSERVLHRVQVSSGVPPELAEVLGGENAVERMLDLIPMPEEG